MCGTRLTPECTVRIRPTTILWIDDDRLLLSVCGETFERYGYRVLPASDGPTGIALARQERPDLILLDVVMFGMDGLEVCQRLRAEPGLAETPIVLLTVLDDAGVRDRGRELGATSIWSKPFGPEELLAKVSKLLGHQPRSATL
jgi:DNA-binding response OmpR family regulator